MASKTGWTSVGERRDDPQDLAGGGLLLQRLGEVAVARLELREEPDVLDGDDGLIGEGLEQLDLACRGTRRALGAPTKIARWTRRRAASARQHAPVLEAHGHDPGIVGILEHVWHVHDSAFEMARLVVVARLGRIGKTRWSVSTPSGRT